MSSSLLWPHREMPVRAVCRALYYLWSDGMEWAASLSRQKALAICFSGCHPCWVKGHYQNYSHRITAAGSQLIIHDITLTLVTQHRWTLPGACSPPFPPPLPPPSSSLFLTPPRLPLPRPTSAVRSCIRSAPWPALSRCPEPLLRVHQIPRGRPGAGSTPRASAGGGLGLGPVEPIPGMIAPPALVSKRQDRPFN